MGRERRLQGARPGCGAACFSTPRTHTTSFPHPSIISLPPFHPPAPSPPSQQAIQKAAFKRGVMLMPAGAREAVRFLPALNVTEGEVHQALEAFDRACGDVFGSG